MCAFTAWWRGGTLETGRRAGRALFVWHAHAQQHSHMWIMLPPTMQVVHGLIRAEEGGELSPWCIRCVGPGPSGIVNDSQVFCSQHPRSERATTAHATRRRAAAQESAPAHVSPRARRWVPHSQRLRARRSLIRNGHKPRRNLVDMLRSLKNRDLCARVAGASGQHSKELHESLLRELQKSLGQKPSVFVSHPWGQKFSALVGALHKDSNYPAGFEKEQVTAQRM